MISVCPAAWPHRRDQAVHTFEVHVAWRSAFGRAQEFMQIFAVELPR